MADVRRIRLEYARELMVSTSLPAEAVAERAGLGSIHAFSRLFKQNFGIPPTHLRKGN